MSSPRLAKVDLPEFGMPDVMPDMPPATYRNRLAGLRSRMDVAGYDKLLVFADREHSASLSYLTGFDPRFEEAMLIVGSEREPLLLVGNECVGMAQAAPLEMRVELFQSFSLPSQPRDRSRPLGEILQSEGVGSSRVGMVGWRTYASSTMLDGPAYVVDEVRRVAGDPDLVTNATGLFIDPGDGLRVINEVEQLAFFEWAACQTSQGVRNLIAGIQPGMSEREAVRLLEWNGMPLSCHLMLTAGERASLGLLSPGDRRLQRGDQFTVAFGIWGALNCRAGFLIESAAELPTAIGDYLERLVVPYFSAIAEWYRALHIGQTGGALFEIVERHLGDPFFGIFLNPGHQIHLEEWVNSPISKGSEVRLRSGMAFQVDVIPATGTEYFTTNIEDGIALADAGLRDEFSRRYPEAWGRIVARRDFMRGALGIDLHPDVLPFSNIPAYLSPFLLSPDHVMTFA